MKNVRRASCASMADVLSLGKVRVPTVAATPGRLGSLRRTLWRICCGHRKAYLPAALKGSLAVIQGGLRRGGQLSHRDGHLQVPCFSFVVYTCCVHSATIMLISPVISTRFLTKKNSDLRVEVRI